MKHLAVRLAVLIALGACGDDKNIAPDASLSIDAPALPATCDTIAQDCPAGFKCSVTATEHQCLPVLGTLAEDSPCTHTGLNDDCAPGLACSPTGTCRSLCTGTNNCTTGQHCIHYRANDGVCEDPCTLLDATTCPSAFSCDIGFEQGAALATYCRRFDATPLGASCIPDVNCGQNASCGNPNALVCSQLCDASHTCSTGTCQHPLADFPTLGVCF
jgi:hypothetical protein